METTILIVEDDVDINVLLTRILIRQGYKTMSAFSGTEAKMLIEQTVPSLILLDLMLPGLTGENLLAYIREECQYTLPVMIISAKNALGDKVGLLKSGADDYITKPFEPEEVVARVEAHLRRRRNENTPSQKIVYKKILLNVESREVTVCDKPLVLTSHEYDILLLLIQNPQKVYSRENIYELVWNGGYYGENNTVNVHVSNLRKKIKEVDSFEEYIQTVYGIGFKMA